MPYAEHAAAQRWATERGISCRVCFAGDLDERSAATLHEAVAASRLDGARWALVVPPGAEATGMEQDLTDAVVTGRVAPAYRSRSVRTLPLPDGVDHGPLHDRLNDEGCTIYAALERAIAHQPIAANGEATALR